MTLQKVGGVPRNCGGKRKPINEVYYINKTSINIDKKYKYKDQTLLRLDYPKLKARLET